MTSFSLSPSIPPSPHEHGVVQNVKEAPRECLLSPDTLAQRAGALSPSLGSPLGGAPSRSRLLRRDAARANVGGVVASGAGSAAGIGARPPARPTWLVCASPGGSRER